jgi:hypothetical protein
MTGNGVESVLYQESLTSLFSKILCRSLKLMTTYKEFFKYLSENLES